MLKIDGVTVAIDEVQAENMMNTKLDGLSFEYNNETNEVNAYPSQHTSTYSNSDTDVVARFVELEARYNQDLSDAYDVCVDAGITPEDKTLTSIIKAVLSK